MKIIDQLIKSKLDNYKIQFNNVNLTLPKILPQKKSVAIIGAGLAGLSSSILLSERGFNVTLLEKENFIGGKVGSWNVKFPDGYQTNVEHGFHAFFKQYYNLKLILKKIDSFKYLIPIDDYLIMTKKYGNFSFKNIETTPIKNILSMRKAGVFSIKDALNNHKFSNMMSLLTYNEEKTFKKYDQISFKEFADDINLPNEMRLMFTTFARAFFAEPEFISMAELIKSFHFYFLSNDYGLLYDVLNDDFQNTLLEPAKNYILNHGGKILTNYKIEKINKFNKNFIIDEQLYDYLIFGTDIKGTKSIIKKFDFVKNYKPNFYNQINNQKVSQRYAVFRIWMDKKIGSNLPFFIFTDAFEILDSITFYHKMENESKEWATKNNGGIYELHCYAIPNDFEESEIRNQFLDEFFIYFPELKSSKIIYENLQIKNDFTAFHTNLYNNRPSTITDIENLYLTGDWVKLPIPAMLMEASVSSALFAVNNICSKENIQTEPIFSVPLNGILG